MGKKLLTTPRGKVKAALRQVWLRSRERAAALKRDKYTCQCCNTKQSKAKGKEFKVEVHHKTGVLNWDEIMSVVYKFLLCDPADLVTMCKECHAAEHEGEELTSTLLDKCDTCIHKGDVYDLECVDCKHFYASKFEKRIKGE